MFSIVTDTGANLTQEQVRALNVTVLPMQTDAESTSQIDPLLGEETLRTLAEKEDVLYIGLSGALSGNCRQMQAAAKRIRSSHAVETLDSVSASCGEGMLVRMAARLRDSGRPMAQVRDTLANAAPEICHLFVVGDAERTVRSGRFGGGTDPSVVMTMDLTGRLVPCRKTADRKAALRYIARMYRRTASPTVKKICIAHADALEDAAFLAGQIGTDTELETLDPLFIHHTGTGTVGLFYPGELRVNPPV